MLLLCCCRKLFKKKIEEDTEWEYTWHDGIIGIIFLFVYTHAAERVARVAESAISSRKLYDEISLETVAFRAVLSGCQRRGLIHLFQIQFSSK